MRGRRLKYLQISAFTYASEFEMRFSYGVSVSVAKRPLVVRTGHKINLSLRIKFSFIQLRDGPIPTLIKDTLFMLILLKN